ncbi:hypothetical protein MPSEU_000791000 [Mayamaea pseudoterrestris]|nr:hypothetical protein MPSEU_000791000 [Mayamaea pseudoterrestris]
MENKKRAREAEPIVAVVEKRTRSALAAAQPEERNDALQQQRQMEQEQGKLHGLSDTYVELASNIVLYEQDQLGPYGYNAAENSWPLQCVSTLEYIKSKLRRGSVMERWSPLEIATFEASMAVYGKVFDKIQKEVKTKSCKEIVDFYYVWKKTKHYERWKLEYVPPYLDVSDNEEEVATEGDGPDKEDGNGKTNARRGGKVNK